MNSYLFYIEGLNEQVWSDGKTEKSARARLWRNLTDDEHDRIVQIECIDVEKNVEFA